MAGSPALIAYVVSVNDAAAECAAMICFSESPHGVWLKKSPGRLTTMPGLLLATLKLIYKT